MDCIIKGIRKYLKDSYHDRLLLKARKIGCVLADRSEGSVRKQFLYFEGKLRKSGGIISYIKNQRLVKQLEKEFNE